MPGAVTTRKPHKTRVSAETDGNYVWSCSCGDYDAHVGMTYRIASAGAKRHRDNMLEMRRILGKVTRRV